MTEPVELAEPVEDRRRRRRGPGVLIACVFVLAGLAIVGGAFAIVGSLTHGFKKPVIIHLQEVRGVLAEDRRLLRPERAGSRTAGLLRRAARGRGVRDVRAARDEVAGSHRGRSAAASAGCSTRLTGYLNPQLAISLAVHLRLPGPGRMAGGHAHGDLRGAGDERAAHRLGPRRVRHASWPRPARRLAAARRPGHARARLRVVDDALRRRRAQRARGGPGTSRRARR